MSELITFEPSIVAAVRDSYERANSAIKIAFDEAIECGRALQFAKDSVGHGRWAQFLDAVDIRPRTASELMRFSEHAELLAANNVQTWAEANKLIRLSNRQCTADLVPANSNRQHAADLEQPHVADADESIEVETPASSTAKKPFCIRELMDVLTAARDAYEDSHLPYDEEEAESDNQKHCEASHEIERCRKELPRLLTDLLPNFDDEDESDLDLIMILESLTVDSAKRICEKSLRCGFNLPHFLGVISTLAAEAWRSEIKSLFARMPKECRDQAIADVKAWATGQPLETKTAIV